MNKINIIKESSCEISTKPVLEALKSAAKRGVDIKIISRTEDQINLPAIKIVGRSYYLEIYKAEIEGNVAFYEWNGNGMAGSNYAKYMIIDNIEGVVGSFNLEYSSLSNSESLLIFSGEKLGEELIKFSNPAKGKEDLRFKF